MTIEDQLALTWSNFKVNLKKAGLVVEKEMHKLVAIDTGKLDQSISTDPVIDRGMSATVEVGTHGVEYAPYVEYGSGGPKNYHRGGSIVYSGVGQHYAERAMNNKAGEVSQILGGSSSSKLL